MLNEREKKQVKETLDVQYGHDWFIETLPDVIDLVAKGRIEGELKSARESVVDVVKVRFPALLWLAEERVLDSSDIGQLKQLHLDLIRAKDQAEAQFLLSSDEGR